MYIIMCYKDLVVTTGFAIVASSQDRHKKRKKKKKKKKKKKIEMISLQHGMKYQNISLKDDNVEISVLSHETAL